VKPSALAATTTFGAVAVSAALICAPGAAARTAAPGAKPGAAARPAAAALRSGSASAARPAAAAPRSGSGSAATAAPQVRVDQVGYPPAAAKTAFVMLPRAAGSVRFVVADPRGGVRLTGRSTDDLGRWNAGYGAVYKLDGQGAGHAGLLRGSLEAVQQRDGRLRGQRGQLAQRRAGRRLHGRVDAGVRARGRQRALDMRKAGHRGDPGARPSGCR
jgi:Cellulase N-terminal ig-like domain